jgi:hypothetical protein
VSSIHINGWFGAQQMAGRGWIVRELLGRDLAQELDRWVYVGDSTNDQLMFQHFTAWAWPTSRALCRSSHICRAM